jgi:heavy metal efflux system protein
MDRSLTETERIEVIWQASQEVRKPMLFGEIIIIIVYLPILALTGVEGKMFTPMAMTVLLALTGALILSFTFVPSAIAVFLSRSASHKENLVTRTAKEFYRPVLRTVLEHRALVVVTATVVVVVSAGAATRMGREFIPTLDEGDVAIHTMRPPDTSLSQAIELQGILEKTLKEKFPQVETIVGRVGTSEIATEPHPPAVGDNTIVLKPREQWPDPNLSKADLVKQFESASGKLLGSNFEFSQPIRMRFNHLLAGVFSDVAVKIFGDNMDVLLRNAEIAAELVRKIPGASHVKVEQVTGLPILTVQLDRTEMARYGLNVSDVQDTVEIAMGGKAAGQVFEGDQRFDIVVRLPEELRTDLDAFRQIPVPLPRYEPAARTIRTLVASEEEKTNRSFVTLGSVTDPVVVMGPNQISREDGKRRIVVTCNVRDRDLGSFVEEAQKTIREGMKLPAGYWINWGGEFEQLISAAKRLELVVPLALLLILALLFSAFGSLKYALLVFTGVPLALTGGIAALWLRDMALSISAAVGFIALSGVAVLNGLVMITFINKLRDEGRPLHEALIQGATTRLRPVLMTALVASLGFVPMATATGTGAEVQKPLATVVIGGLISSTLLTLCVLPALYSLLESRKRVRQADSG